MKTCPACGKKVINKYWESHFNHCDPGKIMNMIYEKRLKIKKQKDRERYLAKQKFNLKG